MGFFTSRATKAPLIDNLRTLIREDEIVVLSEKTKKEIMSYVRSDNGTMSGNPNDDCVMSLAMAGEGLRNRVGDFRKKAKRPKATTETFDSMWAEMQRKNQQWDQEIVR
jgi:hypothetical protein